MRIYLKGAEVQSKQKQQITTRIPQLLENPNIHQHQYPLMTIAKNHIGT